MVEGDEFIGIGVVEGTDQDGVYQTEDGDVGSDPEGQGQDDYYRKGLLAAYSSETELQVLFQPVEGAASVAVAVIEPGSATVSVCCQVHIHLPCPAMSDERPEISAGQGECPAPEPEDRPGSPVSGDCVFEVLLFEITDQVIPLHVGEDPVQEPEDVGR